MSTTRRRYGEVAPVGYLEELVGDAPNGRGNIEFTVVGYGLQSVKPVESALKQRMVGTVSFVNLTSALSGGWSLHYSNNPGGATAVPVAPASVTRVVP